VVVRSHIIVQAKVAEAMVPTHPAAIAGTTDASAASLPSSVSSFAQPPSTLTSPMTTTSAELQPMTDEDMRRQQHCHVSRTAFFLVFRITLSALRTQI
jgi:hypothetical protein